MEPIHMLAAVDFLGDHAQRTRRIEASFAGQGNGRRGLRATSGRARHHAK
jgi:hypothetical protein